MMNVLYTTSCHVVGWELVLTPATLLASLEHCHTLLIQAELRYQTVWDTAYETEDNIHCALRGTCC
jgi:hypothetical protein